MKSIFLAFLLTSFFSSIASAQNNQSLSASCPSGYTVFFGNGIMNNLEEMRYSKERVEEMLGQYYNNEQIRYALSVNPSNGLLIDLVETFAQKMAEDPTLKWSVLLDFLSGNLVEGAIGRFLSDYFLDIQLDPTVQLKQRLAKFTQYSDPTVEKQVSKYISQIIQGRKVMVVAHSQGNLYANAAYYKIKSNPSQNIDINAFGIAGVASPANEVAGVELDEVQSRYITSNNDMVINAMRALEPATLPYNHYSVPLDLGDLLGHGFRTIYTNPYYEFTTQDTLSVMKKTLSHLLNTNVNTDTSSLQPLDPWSRISKGLPTDKYLDTYKYDSPPQNGCQQCTEGRDADDCDYFLTICAPQIKNTIAAERSFIMTGNQSQNIMKCPAGIEVKASGNRLNQFEDYANYIRTWSTPYDGTELLDWSVSATMDFTLVFRKLSPGAVPLTGMNLIVSYEQNATVASVGGLGNNINQAVAGNFGPQRACSKVVSEWYGPFTSVDCDTHSYQDVIPLGSGFNESIFNEITVPLHFGVSAGVDIRRNYKEAALGTAAATSSIKITGFSLSGNTGNKSINDLGWYVVAKRPDSSLIYWKVDESCFVGNICPVQNKPSAP